VHLSSFTVALFCGIRKFAHLYACYRTLKINFLNAAFHELETGSRAIIPTLFQRFHAQQHLSRWKPGDEGPRFLGTCEGSKLLMFDNVQEHPILERLCPLDESRELDFQVVARDWSSWGRRGEKRRLLANEICK
jgi:hypothetical protein